ncbi:MAG: hypothetical protein ACRC3Z_04715 [Phocaeicola sp.]
MSKWRVWSKIFRSIRHAICEICGGRASVKKFLSEAGVDSGFQLVSKVYLECIYQIMCTFAAHTLH